MGNLFGSDKSSGTTVTNGTTKIHNGPGGSTMTNGAIHIDGSKVYDHGT